MATDMMKAIAAARKSEKKKQKAAEKDAKKQKAPIFEPGDNILYWSDSKGKWTDAEVLRRNERDGAVTYDLNLKNKAPPEKIRRKPTEGEEFDVNKPPVLKGAASTFVSFDGFGGKNAKKRGRGSDSEGEGGKKQASEQAVSEPRLDWSDPPSELLARGSFGEEQRGQFIDHFIRYFAAAWEELLSMDLPGFSEVDRSAFGGAALREAREALMPLRLQLARGERLERGETRGEKIKMCGGRTACDGRHVDEAGVLENLDIMTSSAALREYSEAHKAYMRLTLGHKKWNNTCVTHVSASTMQGAREYRRNRDSLNTYDVDPLAQKYMQALRKLLHFAQRIRPNEDQSKNVVI